jgi:hypothetical protein
MHSRVMLGLVAAIAMCALASCGGDDGRSATAVRVGNHVITSGRVNHVMSVLLERNSRRAIPTPPDYHSCIAEQRAHRGQAVGAQPGHTEKQLKAFCEFEFHRFRLKALYLLISYQWVKGEAGELGVVADKEALRRQLAVYEQGLGLKGDAAFRRYLRAAGANLADIYLSLELAQLTTKVEEKIGEEARPGETVAHALARFGKAYKRKWRARTDCSQGYVVPICRQYRRPKKPPALVPPSVPLTAMPAGE